MTAPAHDVHPEREAQTTTARRHRRTIAFTAVTVGALVAAVAVVDINSSSDEDITEIAFGSSWS